MQNKIKGGDYLSLDNNQEKINQKTKYEFMQEFSIMPGEREEKKKVDKENNIVNINKTIK